MDRSQKDKKTEQGTWFLIIGARSHMHKTENGAKETRNKIKGEQTAIKPACVKGQGCKSQLEGISQAFCPSG